LVAASESLYVTDGEQNFGGYTDPTVDGAWAAIVRSANRDQANELKVPMERALWSNPYNAPLYANPGLAATTSAISGAVFNPTQFRMTWNAATWTTRPR